jgi:rod shape determining protein RodA
MKASNWQHFDFWLLGAVAVLTIFGIAMIGSTTTGNIALANAGQRQLVFAVLGFGVLFAIAAVDYHLWSSINRILYIGMFLALAVLQTLGSAVFGSARWFQTALVSIQPSEFAKIIIILVLAEFFARNKHKLGSLVWVLRSLVTTMGLVVWILIQPNLSTSIVILVIWFALLWVSGLKFRHLALFGVAAVVVPVLAFPFLAEYQQNRITNFLVREDSETARYGDRYNLDQAQISIGSGGLLGQGYGQGSQVQLRFLKVRWSDFIFSAMAEELGFIITAAILGILLFVIYRCIRVARLARDNFGALIAYGVAVLLAFQAMVNVGVNLDLLPATGLPLPFISYGGSSLFSLLMGIGLVQSVIIRHKTLEFSA